MTPKTATKPAAKKPKKGSDSAEMAAVGKKTKAPARDELETDSSDDAAESVETQLDEAEELEEQQEEVAARSSAQSGHAAALAAASGNSSEMSASFKNFRHHPDMENFYRFIFENDLRHEALAIIDEIIVQKAEKRSGKPGKN
ncbi:MAG: hypothetical protein ACO3A2_08590 [Bdellovibrionia bacterium]